MSPVQNTKKMLPVNSHCNFANKSIASPIAPRELAFLSEHSFVQRTILYKGNDQQHLRTDEGIGVLGLCGKNYPFFFQKPTEEKQSYPLITQWDNPYQHIGPRPAGPIFASYVRGGWKNNTLAQWQHAHHAPAVLFLPDVFVCNPQLEELGFPLTSADLTAQMEAFMSQHQDNASILSKSVYNKAFLIL